MTGHTGPLVSLCNVGFTYSTRSGMGRHHRIEALTDIDFDIEWGETLGIIGRNGCGKSTLLRILTGIYEPDSGEILRASDRVSLLSLNVGFDPELTGSQNLVLASMFLGSSRRQAVEKHDDIVTFAGLEDFIDRPLKTYSSGMKARLGFSVAMKMDADLLLIDEVLGVGDASFKRKAQEAMINRINSDQTVVFVSHSMKQVYALCSRVIWLENGAVHMAGTPDEVIPIYEEQMENAEGVGNRAQYGK